MSNKEGTIAWGQMQQAINETVKKVNDTLQEVETATSSQKIEVVTKLQWEMAIMQQVLTAASNVIEGSKSIIKSALSMISR